MSDFSTTGNSLDYPSLHIMPDEFFGYPQFPLAWDELNWLADLPTNTFFSLWLKIPPGQDLPEGHPLYVIGYFDEPIEVNWLRRQISRIQQPIIILNDGNFYNFSLPDNVYFFRYYSWHKHVETIKEWFPDRQPKKITCKASAVCNRITVPKLVVFTALMETLTQSELCVKLGTWLEEKNVHYRQLTGNQSIDKLTDIFFEKYFGQEIKFDEFSQDKNYQRINSNPWNPLYLNSALHFTNESYDYSSMIDTHGDCIWPGPCLSEKTYKCLIAGTPFISVGQFDVYQSFAELGFKFDYGTLDLSWDQDPGNLTRLEKIVELIKTLKHYSIGDIINATKNSTEHNFDHVWSGEFTQICQEHNRTTAHQIIKQFSSP